MYMKKKLIIVGAGGCGREIAQIAKDIKNVKEVDWEIYGFIDDYLYGLNGIENSRSILGTIQEWIPKDDEIFICGVGVPKHREKLSAILEEKGAQFTNIIHPTAIINSSSKYGNGLVVYPYTCISVNTNIGKHVLLNMHNAIGHDAEIGDHSVLSSFCDITGYVKLGNKVFLGSHVCIAPGLKIGDNAYLGLGSVVVSSIKEGKSVFGNPARTLKL